MPEVVVVGAGIAGLSVTAMLAAAGVEVVCLEARDRVGGRLLSVDSLDLGATWFWAGEHRVQRLMEGLGVGSFAQYTAGDGVYEEDRGVRRLDGNPIDHHAFRYGGGAQNLADRLAAGLAPGVLTLSAPVTEIGVDADGLRVQTEGISFAAAHVVLAVPPALAMRRIRFVPELPDALASVAVSTPVWMGAVSKVVVVYPEPFWRARGLAGAAVSRCGPLWEIHDMSGADGAPAALFGFAATAEADPRMVGDRAREEVVAQLVRVFGSPADTPSQFLLQDWGRQIDTSPPGVHLFQDYGHFGSRRFGVPALGGRLHWASTETSPISPGHVEGALAAAERAASAVLALAIHMP